MQSTRAPFRAETYQPMAFQRSRRSAGSTMPACRYGTHCTMPRCVYRHPSPTTTAAARASPAVCINFLSGTCDFGDACWNHHPATVGERQAVLRALARRPCTNPKPCPYGDACLFRCCS